MRLARTRDDRIVALDGDTAVDLTDLAPVAAGASPAGTLAALIAAVEAGSVTLDAAALSGCPQLDLASVELGAPLPRPGKIMAAPANYYDHVNEMPDSATVVEWGIFLKAPTSVTSDGATIALPYADKRTDQEGELAVVIGKGGRFISAEAALDHVFGYTTLLDITVRSTEDRSARKSFDGFTPLGPWVVTADEIGDPSTLELRCSVNDDLRQQTTLDKLIYGVPQLIAYVSSVMTLEPGDVLATGTPAGVGPLAHGDTISLEISRIGSLSVTVDASAAIAYADRPSFVPLTGATR
jgi:2-keto-4-pentenoate hydratase/2-oxohepta-3-ene-1,7-dioic acid hydratase in catechol pathway